MWDEISLSVLHSYFRRKCSGEPHSLILLGLAFMAITLHTTYIVATHPHYLRIPELYASLSAKRGNECIFKIIPTLERLSPHIHSLFPNGSAIFHF